MKKIKKISKYLALVLLPTFALAASSPNISPLPTTSLTTLLGNIQKAILTIAGTIILICLIIAGVLFATAGGDKGRVEAAKQWLTNAIYGILVILLANSIIYIITRVVSTGTP